MNRYAIGILLRKWLAFQLLIGLVLVLNGCFKLTTPTTDPSTSADATSAIGEQRVARKTTPTYRTLLSNRIRSITANADELWIATDSGVSRWQRTSETWTHYTKADGLAHDGVSDVALDLPWVWFATEGGVSRYNVETGAWKTFRKEQGLTSNRIRTIAVDGDYVWFGTDKGLCRYDKTIDSWAARTKQDGLVSNVIRTLAVGEEYIWLGTGAEPDERRFSRFRDFSRREERSKGGVSRYHRPTDSWNQYTQQDGLVDNEISAIAIDEENVWFGTYSAGVSLFNQIEQSFVHTYTESDLLASNLIQVIAADGHQVWFGTANAGVQRFIRSVNTWVHYTQQDGLASDHVSAIAVQGNYVWFGSKEHGLSRYDKVSGGWERHVQAERLVSNDVRQLCQNGEGQLWAATSDGLSLYDPQHEVWTPYRTHNGLVTDYVTDVTCASGTTWIATDRGLGVLDIARDIWSFHQPHNGLRASFVNCVEYQGDTLWAGTNRGIYALLDGADTWLHLGEEQGLPRDTIRTLRWLNDSLWIGTAQGIYQYQPVQEQVHFYPVQMVNTFQLTASGLWVGTLNGLWLYDVEKDDWEFIAERPNIRCVAEHKGEIWLGTAQGLEVYHPESREWTSYQEQLPYPIRDICVLGDSLWIATPVGLAQYELALQKIARWHCSQDNGAVLREPGVAHLEFDGDSVWMSNWYQSVNGAIMRYHRSTGTWQRFLRQDILGATDVPSMSQVHRVRAGEDAVWFATNLGLLRYDKWHDTWKRFTVEDGLASNEVREIVPTQNAVWVAPNTGPELSRYDRETETWSLIELADDFPFASVQSIAADDQNLWIGLSSSVFRYDQTARAWIEHSPANGLASVGATWIEVDPDYVWVAGGRWGRNVQKVLSRYDKHRDTWEAFSTNDVLASNRISRIIVQDRYVWIVYSSYEEAGVSRFDRETGDWINIRPMSDWGSGVEEFAMDDNYLWLGTEDNGVQRYHFASGSWSSFGREDGLMSDHTLPHALKVDERYVWVGTPYGLSRYDKHSDSWDSFTMQPSLPGREVRTLAADERYVWCGTDQGLARYDKQYGGWENFHEWERTPRWGSSATDERLADDNINTILLDEDYLWIATRNGASRYDYKAGRWARYRTYHGLPAEDVTCLSSDGSNIWMGTAMGIGRYPRASDDPNAWVSFTSGTEIQASAASIEFAETLVADEVWCLSAGQNSIWAGTRLGVSRYDTRKGIWRTYTRKDGLPTDEVNCIQVAGEQVWFGTNAGATVYDMKAEEWQTYDVSDGLPDNSITAIQIAGPNIWFGTHSNGAGCLNTETGQWSYYRRRDGLAHNGVLAITVDGEHTWFGTQRGLSRLDQTSNTWTTFTEFHGPEDLDSGDPLLAEKE